MTGIGKAVGFAFLLLLILAVYPMEQPGMLNPWIGIEPSFVFTTKLLKFSILELVLGTTFGMSLLYWNSLARRIPYKNNFGLFISLILACIAWGYIGTVFSDQTLSMDNLGIDNWKRLIYGIIVFISVTLFIDTKKKLHNAIYFIVLAAFFLDVWGLGRYVFAGGLPVHSYTGKVVFWETVKLALNVFVVTYVLGMLLFDSSSLSPRRRLLYKIVLTMAYAVIFLSSRRTSMIMTLFATAIFLWVLARRGRPFIAVSVLAVSVLGMSIFAMVNYQAFETKFISRFVSLAGIFDKSVEVDKSSTQSHMSDLRKGLNTAIEHPIWGVGFGWDEVSSGGGQDYVRPVYWVHNSLLTFWLRFGLLGVVTYLYIYYKILTVLFRSYSRTKDTTLLIFLVWFFVEFLSGFFFPPFFGYFKMVALFMGTLGLANADINTMNVSIEPITTNEKDLPALDGRILRRCTRADT